ncbi:MAG: winged helix-turn-helix transcriptional regulator [Proteobacteria bacterium]|nr:winged helix-turn-helix transcriptional regulator [Pseudomonadota bacterium]
MIEPFHSRYLLPTKDFRCLSVLLTIHEVPAISQTRIGKATHLSSSMVNNYIKKFKSDGLIKVIGDTNRTTSYHLTEAGFDMLSSKLLDYSAEIVQLYTSVKKEIIRILNGFYNEGIRQVVFYGAAETAEIVYAALQETEISLMGVIDGDPQKKGQIFNGYTIQSFEGLKDLKFDAVIIASFGKQEEIYRSIKAVSDGRIVIKRLSDL